eukprot:5767857-Prymnesium_polylepis.1
MVVQSEAQPSTGAQPLSSTARWYLPLLTSKRRFPFVGRSASIVVTCGARLITTSIITWRPSGVIMSSALQTPQQSRGEPNVGQVATPSLGGCVVGGSPRRYHAPTAKHAEYCGAVDSKSEAKSSSSLMPAVLVGVSASSRRRGAVCGGKPYSCWMLEMSGSITARISKKVASALKFHR